MGTRRFRGVMWSDVLSNRVNCESAQARKNKILTAKPVIPAQAGIHVRNWGYGGLLLIVLLLVACSGESDGSLESLPSITSLRELDSAIVMTTQVWPEDERGSYFAQFAFDPDADQQRLYRWRIDIQSQGKCRTKWFDWSQEHDTVRFYCGRGIYLQPVAAKPGELLPAPEIPEREEGWIQPSRNGSPDDEYLLYSVPSETSDQEQLMVINTATRQSQPIPLPDGARHLTTKWAPDGQSFVVLVQFGEDVLDRYWDVYQVARDSWTVRVLEGMQLTSISRELSWSNDGASLLYGQADAKGATLWVYDFASDRAESIFGFSNEENDVGVHAWSPDDQRIVFVSSFEASCSQNDSGVTSCGRNMHIMDRNGQNVRDVPGMGEQDDLAWVVAE